jgi:predicted ATP-grasp superfamily ATP-dependent carboligase
MAAIARGFDVLFPVTSKTIMEVAAHPELFNGVSCFIPDSEKIDFIQNKANLCRFAQELGISIPATYFPHSEEEVRALSGNIAYPIYVKLCEEQEYSPRERYRVARSAEELLDGYLLMSKRADQLILQEKVPGRNVGFFALLDENSEVIAQFCHRRIRQFPYDGGPSTYCEGYTDTQVITAGRKLLEELKWKGLAMAEFVVDETDGLPWLLEVNPRLWGSIPLALKAGIDFPLLLVKKSLGQEVEKVTPTKTRVRLRFLPLDLFAIAAKIKREKGKLKTLISCLLDLFNPTVPDGIIQLADIKPALAYFGRIFGRKKRS